MIYVDRLQYELKASRYIKESGDKKGNLRIQPEVYRNNDYRHLTLVDVLGEILTY